MCHILRKLSMRDTASVCKHRVIPLGHQNLRTVLLPPMLLPACRFGTTTLAFEGGGRRRAEMFNGWTSTSAKVMQSADGLKVVRASLTGAYHCSAAFWRSFVALASITASWSRIRHSSVRHSLIAAPIGIMIGHCAVPSVQGLELPV